MRTTAICLTCGQPFCECDDQGRVRSYFRIDNNIQRWGGDHEPKVAVSDPEVECGRCGGRQSAHGLIYDPEASWLWDSGERPGMPVAVVAED
jgi:hypothetical protein